MKSVYALITTLVLCAIVHTLLTILLQIFVKIYRATIQVNLWALYMYVLDSFSIGGSVTFDYNNSTFNKHDRSYANLFCTGDEFGSSCTQDIVDDCDSGILVLECLQGMKETLLVAIYM